MSYEYLGLAKRQNDGKVVDIFTENGKFYVSPATGAFPNPPRDDVKATMTKLFIMNAAMIFVVYSIFPDLQGSYTLLKVNPEKKAFIKKLWAFAILFTVGMAYMMAREGKLVDI